MKTIDLAATALCAILTISSISTQVRAADEKKHRPNLLVISIDTLRADAVGVYGNGSELTPNIDSVAKGGIVATGFYSHAPWTRASFGSLFTSLYPWQHQAERNMESGLDSPLSPKAVTLAEVLNQAGYLTAAFQSNGNAGKTHGFNRGFDTWKGIDLVKDDSELPYAPANVTYSAFESWFTKEAVKDGKPFFAWMNFMDPHMPYVAREAHGKGILDPDYKGQINSPFANYRLGRTGKLSAKDKDRLKDMYDSEVRYSDSYIGKVLDLLNKSGEDSNTLVVITSDHGEEFFDHGRGRVKGLKGDHDWGFGHGHTLFNELVHVPLIMKLPGVPGSLKSVTEVKDPIRQIDFMPTVLEILGVKSKASTEFKGTSVVKLLKGDRKDYATPDILIGSVLYGSELRAIIAGGYKLILDTSNNTALMFDLEKDPQELEDVSKKAPKRFELLMGKLQQWIKSMGPERSQQKKTGQEPEATTEELMKKLGY